MTKNLLPNVSTTVLDQLAAEIRRGQCVAFVGAGFSADVNPKWDEMIAKVITEVGREPGENSEHLTTASDLLEDNKLNEAISLALYGMSSQQTARIIGAAISADAEKSDRDRRLAGIPFRTVLTTNYDGRPGGVDRGHEAYETILRGNGALQGWWDESYWRSSDGGTSSWVMALHGQIGSHGTPPLVVTNDEYRDLLYRTPGYRTFLTSLFATTTLLFLGKSFNDEYLNDLRSELVALFGNERLGQPLAYAAVHAGDYTQAQEEYFRDREGIQLLRYGTGEETGGPDDPTHAGFDALLEELHRRTNFFKVLQSALAGLTIVWHDSNEPRSDGAADVDDLIERIRDDSAVTFVRYHHADEVVANFESDQPDILITNYGHYEERSRAADLMANLRRAGHHAPTIIFSGPDHVAANRAKALKMGAFALESDYGRLFEKLKELADGLTHDSS